MLSLFRIKIFHTKQIPNAIYLLRPVTLIHCRRCGVLELIDILKCFYSQKMTQIGKSLRPKSVIPHREDMCHEFKGHSCISADEISPHRFYIKSKSITIKSVSRTICGFLNTGFGGKALLGVFDDGKAIGLPLTADQQQHILLSLADTLERYNPPVPRERLRVRFIPVLSDEEAFEESQDSNSSVHDSALEFDVDKPHVLRRPHICCWCFKKGMYFM